MATVAEEELQIVAAFVLGLHTHFAPCLSILGLPGSCFGPFSVIISRLGSTINNKEENLSRLVMHFASAM